MTTYMLKFKYDICSAKQQHAKLLQWAKKHKGEFIVFSCFFSLSHQQPFTGLHFDLLNSSWLTTQTRPVSLPWLYGCFEIDDCSPKGQSRPYRWVGQNSINHVWLLTYGSEREKRGSMIQPMMRSPLLLALIFFMLSCPGWGNDF